MTKPISELSKQIRNPKEFMAARDYMNEIYSIKQSVSLKDRALSFVLRKTTVSYDRASEQSKESKGSFGHTGKRAQSNEPKARGSSIGLTHVQRKVDGEAFAKEREQVEKMNKMKQVNEVDALRGVFYNFFDIKDVRGRDNINDKVLISMQLADSSLNPFFQIFDEELDENEMDTSSHMFANSVNNSLFKNLSPKRQVERQMFAAESENNEQLQTSRGGILDTIKEQPGDDEDNIKHESSELYMVNEESEISKPKNFNQRRATLMSETTIKTDDENFADDQRMIFSDSYDEAEQPSWVDHV